MKNDHDNNGVVIIILAIIIIAKPLLVAQLESFLAAVHVGSKVIVGYDRKQSLKSLNKFLLVPIHAHPLLLNLY